MHLKVDLLARPKHLTTTMVLDKAPLGTIAFGFQTRDFSDRICCEVGIERIIKSLLVPIRVAFDVSMALALVLVHNSTHALPCLGDLRSLTGVRIDEVGMEK